MGDRSAEEQWQNKYVNKQKFLLLSARSRDWEEPFLKVPVLTDILMLLPNKDPETGLQLAENWNFFTTWEVSAFCQDYILENGKDGRKMEHISAVARKRWYLAVMCKNWMDRQKKNNTARWPKTIQCALFNNYLFYLLNTSGQPTRLLIREINRTPPFLQAEQLQGLEIRINIHVCP